MSMEVAKDRVTFDRFTRRAAALFDRRALFGGASAALLAATSLPLATEAKKGKHMKCNKNKQSKACKKRMKECRRLALPECEPHPEIENCEPIVNNCCEKACQSEDKAFDCIEDNLTA